MALKPDKYTTRCPVPKPTYSTRKTITFLPSKVAYRYPIQLLHTWNRNSRKMRAKKKKGGRIWGAGIALETGRQK